MSQLISQQIILFFKEANCVDYHSIEGDLNQRIQEIVINEVTRQSVQGAYLLDRRSKILGTVLGGLGGICIGAAAGGPVGATIQIVRISYLSTTILGALTGGVSGGGFGFLGGEWSANAVSRELHQHLEQEQQRQLTMQALAASTQKIYDEIFHRFGESLRIEHPQRAIEDWKCPINQTLWTIPVSTGCVTGTGQAHIFNLTSLVQHLLIQLAERRSMSCPMCRRQIDIDRVNIDQYLYQKSGKGLFKAIKEVQKQIQGSDRIEISMRKAAELFFGQKVTQSNPRLYAKPIAKQTKKAMTITFKESLLLEGRKIRDITIDCADQLEELECIDESMGEKLTLAARRWNKDIQRTLREIGAIQ